MNPVQRVQINNQFVDQFIKDSKLMTFWESVETIMKYLAKDPYHRIELRKLKEEIRRDREVAHNPLAMSKQKSLRHVGAIPGTLFMLLNTVYGERWPVTSKTFKRIFFTRYPDFRVTSKY